MTIQNQNIMAQDGCFAVNFSESQPYEHGKLFCVDVNRSLFSHIVANYLAPNNINSSTIYPSALALYDAAKKAKDSAKALL